MDSGGRSGIQGKSPARGIAGLLLVGFSTFFKGRFMKNTFVRFSCLQVHLTAGTLNGTKEEKIYLSIFFMSKMW